MSHEYSVQGPTGLLFLLRLSVEAFRIASHGDSLVTEVTSALGTPFQSYQSVSPHFSVGCGDVYVCAGGFSGGGARGGRLAVAASPSAVHAAVGPAQSGVSNVAVGCVAIVLRRMERPVRPLCADASSRC